MYIYISKSLYSVYSDRKNINLNCSKIKKKKWAGLTVKRRKQGWVDPDMSEVKDRPLNEPFNAPKVAFEVTRRVLHVRVLFVGASVGPLVKYLIGE